MSAGKAGKHMVGVSGVRLGFVRYAFSIEASNDY